MSLNMRATRRLSLLAGSSFAAVGLATISAMGAMVAPTSALAANECAPAGVAPSANGPIADTYACAGSYAATGITYSSAGNLTVNSTGALNVGAAGVNLTANGSDSVTFTATGNVSGTSGPIIDVNSSGISGTPGALNVSIAGMTVTGANVTYGVNAVSTTGGAVNVSTSGVIRFIRIGVPQHLSAIRAVSTGGNGAVTVTTEGEIVAPARGIEAQSSGAGALTITARGGVTAATAAGVGVAAIDATTGNGLMTIDIDEGDGAIDGGSGAAILANAGGNVNISIAEGRKVLSRPDSSTVLDIAAAGASSITNNGSLVRFGGGNPEPEVEAAFDKLTVRATGGSILLNNNGVFSGRVDLDGLTGNATINNNAGGTWTTGGTSTFGAGVNTINNAGALVVRDATFEGLDQLNNSSVIYLGTVAPGPTGDILNIEGVTFAGTGDSRIAMDVDFSGSQSECVAGGLADCVNVSGGSTAGSTLLTVRYADGSASGSSSNILLVEGSTGASNFALDPNSDGYTETANGPMLRRQFYGYRLVYDEASQAHLLAAAPLDETFQPSTYAASAQEIWRTTTGSWFDRQADLRSTPGGLEASGGVWGRVGVGGSERHTDAVATQAAGSTISSVDYSQRTSHVLFGADFVGAATEGSYWVLGGTAGFVRTDAEYEGAPADVTYTGFTGGFYASWISGPLFIDANFNANILDVVADIPSLQLADNVNLTQKITSLGARIEGGWRFEAADRYFVEPLVGAAYVTTNRDDIGGLDGAQVFGFDDDATSLRVGAGLRVGADLGFMSLPASYSLTGRYWTELEGENTNTLAGSSPTVVVDEFSGEFAELAAGVNLFSPHGAVSGFMNLGAKFADDYSSVDGAVGVRMRW